MVRSPCSPVAAPGARIAAIEPVWTSRGGPAPSVRVGYKILNPVNGTDCVRAFTVLAFWDSTAEQLARLNPSQRAMLEGHKMLGHGSATAITQ